MSIYWVNDYTSSSMKYILWSSMLGTMSSMIIRMDLMQPGSMIKNNQIYNTIVTL